MHAVSHANRHSAKSEGTSTQRRTLRPNHSLRPVHRSSRIDPRHCAMDSDANGADERSLDAESRSKRCLWARGGAGAGGQVGGAAHGARRPGGVWDGVWGLWCGVVVIRLPVRSMCLDEDRCMRDCVLGATTSSYVLLPGHLQSIGKFGIFPIRQVQELLILQLHVTRLCAQGRFLLILHAAVAVDEQDVQQTHALLWSMISNTFNKREKARESGDIPGSRGW